MDRDRILLMIRYPLLTEGEIDAILRAMRKEAA